MIRIVYFRNKARRLRALHRCSPLIWVVRVGDELFVRSYRGDRGAWYRHATRRARGRVRAGGVAYDVGFVPAAGVPATAVDDAYRAKYGRYAGSHLDPMVSDRAAATTLQLIPQN